VNWCPSSSLICLLQTTHNLPTEVLQCVTRNTQAFEKATKTLISQMPDHTLRFISYSLGIAGFKSWQRHNLSLLQNIQAALGAQSAPYSLEIRGSFPKIELPRHEGKHLSPSSDEFKNVWNKAPTPPTWQHKVYGENFNIMNGELFLNMFYRYC